jgi:SAM-dependent methyltransferase
MPTLLKQGTTVYKWFLPLYDLWVLGVCNKHAWSCPTKSTLLPFYKRNLRTRHLDIGPGTGYYLVNSSPSPETQITLLDLNPKSLAHAANRLVKGDRPGNVHIVQADVMGPLPLTGVFDSISLFFLLHCLPGTVREKMGLFKNLDGILAPGGVVYGSTVLGKGVRYNLFGRFLMKYLNSGGVFCNLHDGEVEIRQALEKEFMRVETWVVGCVLLFEAEGPRKR